MRRIFLLALLSLSIDAAAAPVVIAVVGSAPSQPVAARDPVTGRIDVVYTTFNLYPSSVNWALWQAHSPDDGASWTTPAPIEPGADPRIVTVQRTSASLLHAADGPVLVYQWYTGGGTGLWQARGTDGPNFPTATPVGLGWAQPADVQPRVVPASGGALAMLYLRGVAEGDRPPGLYSARSPDGGASWDDGRTLVATDALTAFRPGYAVRTSDGRHVAAYGVDGGGGSHAIVVRTSANGTDWSAAPIPIAAADDPREPDVSLLPDGTFLLVWARTSGSGRNLVARRSTNGSDWSGEVTLVEGNGAVLGSPFALTGPSAGTVDLYWARTTSTDPLAPAGVIEHETVVVIDTIFTHGFD